MDAQIFKKITSKKEFSQLLRKDVELALGKFDGANYSDEEKVKLTRELLKRVFGAFSGRRLLSGKLKDVSWILAHHVSAKERVPYYSEIYKRLLNGFNEKLNVIDLGCGVNGFSYKYFENKKINYLGVEAVGQLVNLTNDYFKRERISGKVVHESLFELEKIKGLVKSVRGKKIVFLFKVVDCLEMMKMNYSKKLLKEIAALADRIVVSFATESFVKRKKFFVQRRWFLDFVKENFRVVEDFEVGGERYVVISR